MGEFVLERKNTGEYKLIVGSGVETIPYLSAANDERLRNVIEIFIPDNVKEIDDYAFMDFENLEKIQLPSSVNKIGKYIFKNCISLTEAELPDKLMVISSHAFENCINLRKIDIPQSVTEISEGAFMDCHNLRNVILPRGLLSIGNKAFESCENLKALDIPDTVSVIGKGCFSKCISLKEINVPASVSCLRMDTFASCERLERVRLPEALIRIDDGCFYKCARLNHLAFPSVVFNNGNIESAFLKCYSLNDIQMPIKTACSLPLKSLFFKSNNSSTRVIGISLENIFDLQIETEKFSLLNNEIFLKAPLFNALNDTDITQVCSFLENPIRENLKGLKTDIGIPLAIAYHEHDEQLMKYLKSHIIKVLEIASQKEDLTYLDFIIDNKLISNRMIDKCLEYVEKNEFHEAFIVLTQYKEEIGGYNKNNTERFEL